MRQLLLVLLLLASWPAPAQQLPIPPALRPPAAPDTAAALRRLFASRRQRCDWLVGGTLVAGVATAALVVALPAASAGGGGGGYGSLVSAPLINGPGIEAFVVGVFTVPVVLTEVLLAGGWGKKQEQRTIEAWQQHRLPRYYKKRLLPRYFPASVAAAQP